MNVLNQYFVEHGLCISLCRFVSYLNCFACIDPDMPEHNLEPPRFSRKALERILNDWTAVKAMLMTGCRESKSPRSAQDM